MGKTVWADCFDVPGNVCPDARLRDAAPKMAYPGGSTKGQSGWDVGLHFKSLNDLAAQVEKKFRRGEITRLAIHCHGLPGQFFPSGEKNKGQAISARSVLWFKTDLVRIGLRTDVRATIMIAGCLAGLGKSGTDLLKELSRHAWPDRKIVAFTTIGFAWGGEQMRDKGCTEPGMRDTNNISRALDRSLENRVRKLWPNLKKLPWASETSPHAKVVRNGVVLRSPPEVVRTTRKEPLWLNKELWDMREKIRKWQRGKPTTREMKKKLAAMQGAYMRRKREIEEKKKVTYQE